MPLLIECFWLIGILFTSITVIIQVKKLKFRDPQVRAIQHFGTMYDLVKNEKYFEVIKESNLSEVSNHPHIDIAFWLRAIAYNNLEIPEAALQETESALSLELNNPGVYLERAKALLALGNYTGAKHALEYTKRLNPYWPGLDDLEIKLTSSFKINNKSRSEMEISGSTTQTAT
jgi:tetratricopeptide (TPR) repeat protein